MRLIEGGYERFLHEIRNVFNISGQTDQYIIESPVIELTITRFELMRQFEEKQKRLYIDFPTSVCDRFSHIQVPNLAVMDVSQKFVTASIPAGFESVGEYVSTDEEYLVTREMCVWCVFRSLYAIGSVFVILWFAAFSVVVMIRLLDETMPERPWTLSMAIGYGITMLLVELLSFRVCLAKCCQPEKATVCYPGYLVYSVQYICACLASVAMIISALAEKMVVVEAVPILIAQHGLAMIVPILFQPCFFRWEQRVDRKFKWIRISFFRSWCWPFVQVIFCLLFTPGILGVQTLLAAALRNRPRVGTSLQRSRLEPEADTELEDVSGMRAPEEQAPNVSSVDL
jgi:hypothetical protein